MRALVLLCTLLLASSAQAMIAVDMYRAPLSAAAHQAAECEGAIPGNYSVTVTVGPGRPRVELRREPGVRAETRKCMRRAFALATYPDPHHGTIQLNYPFVITPPPEGTP